MRSVVPVGTIQRKDMSFEALGLCAPLLAAISRAGFTDATEVQKQAIPAALQGQDLMVSAQTGSGKTAAFMLPSLNRLAQFAGSGGRGVQVLVLTPTRELAMQVSQASEMLGEQIKGLRVATVVGGMPYGAQLKALSKRVDVLVATPGRLMDHLNNKRVDLSTVHTLILDEADRMLDMGFIDDIKALVARTPASRQTLLFSATLDGNVARLAQTMMREPRRIEISAPKARHEQIEQTVFYADNAGHKMRLLDHVLRDTAVDQAIVFTATKRGADALAESLNEQGFHAQALHGDMNQRQRTRALTAMQRGRVKVLVATDVAARGIDVQTISHAINFDLPMQAEDYVHRIGRTGRAGRQGTAITLVEHRERFKIRRIEQFIGHPIAAAEIAGLEPRAQAPKRPAKPAGARTAKPRRPGSTDVVKKARATKPYTERHAKRPVRSEQRSTQHRGARA
jgi:superfamily II DNA/RNA helicase